MKRDRTTYTPVNIPPSICPICGRSRNQYTNHRACSLQLQQQKAAYNATRVRTA